MIAPEQWKGKCLACGKMVDYSTGFACSKKPGNHRLESVTFFHTGGRDLQHPFDRRAWAPTLIYPRASKMDERTGKMVQFPPLEVQFGQTGRLDSDDAEVIFNLQTNSRGVGWGEAGQRMWDQIYLTPAGRIQKEQAELDRVHNQLVEANALLEQTKRQKVEARH